MRLLGLFAECFTHVYISYSTNLVLVNHFFGDVVWQFSWGCKSGITGKNKWSNPIVASQGPFWFHKSASPLWGRWVFFVEDASA